MASAPPVRAIRAVGLAALLVLQACGDGSEPDRGATDAAEMPPEVDAGEMPVEDPFWSTLSEAAWLEPRVEHTAVWTGTEMIVWGGVLGDFRSDAIFGDGGRYDPVTDSWLPMAEGGAPSPRATHTAVWTGSEMIVWGGGAYDVEQTPNSTIYRARDFGDGGRYDPATDSWRPLSPVEAPSPRHGHHAVWTGSEMIVWGGDDLGTGIGPLNSGSIYDPSTDSWRTIDTFDLPPVVQWSTGLFWTGSDLLVLATSEVGSVPYVGARYDLESGSWSLINMKGAPAIRPSQAVWTDAEMIVWGARIEGGGRDGGRYDPASDSWKAMTDTDDPPATYPSIVWTGSRALIWGGRAYVVGQEDAAIKFGATYDPGTDAWESLPTPVDNVGRESHTAIWTGSEMIVWGGSRGGGPNGMRYLNSGALYRP
jgi:hypothetical protein